MSAIIPTLAVLALVSSPAPAAAQTIPPTVEPGLKVAVIDDGGASVEGRVQSVSDRFVTLAVRGATRDIPVEHIVRIERPDTVKNGALIGLGIGATMGLIATVADPQRGGVLVWRVLGNGVMCAGLGALIDAGVNNRKTLFERGARAQTRLTPVFGRGVRAVTASIAW